ncbi:hypothetical protein [uncultured Kordia sp.]|uniref:hypothetical protein n=1 Tax=uncultured Kordia sp. TaxID=507699 RepID=UPI002635BCC6|nr:hypothetical protein [uncultured Kordia sp.]
MKVKKYLLPSIFLLVIFVTACTSDDITGDESPTRQSELQGNTQPVATSIRVEKDSVTIRVDNITNTRIKNTEYTSAPRRRRN